MRHLPSSDEAGVRGGNAASAVMLSLLCLSNAMAQELAVPAQEPTADASDTTGLEEVIVTAEKRIGTLQTTPIAISVVGSEALQRNGVGDLRDLSNLAPGLNFSQEAASVIVTIRGVSSRDVTEIGDPAVSVSQDGFYIQRPMGFADSLYDLERVEVLRGPQGTLYGRNATGGAINFITAKPEDEFGARAALGYGNYDAVTTEGMVNLPVSERVQVRAAFSTRNRDGYRENESPAPAGDDADSKSGRVHVQLLPTDRLTLLLTAQYTDVGGVGATLYGYPLPIDPVSGLAFIDPNLKPPIDREGSPHGLPSQYVDATTTSLQWNAQYEFDFATLIYLGGYRKLDFDQFYDLDGLLKSDAYWRGSETPVDRSHELRLVSNTGSRFKWQLGGFYFAENNDLLSFFQSAEVPSAPVNLFTFDYLIKSEALAGFAQASYEIIDGLELELGLRQSHDEKRRTGLVDFGGGPIPMDQSTSEDQTTYHLGATYKITPRNMLYVKHDTGYKAGGFADGGPYGPEKIYAWEAGSKNMFLGNRLQVNAAAFWYDYKDQQVSQFADGLTTVFNAGKSRVKGAELELLAEPASGLRIDGSVGYLDAEYVDFCTVVIGGVCQPDADFAGNRPPSAPEWQLGAGIQYEFGMQGHGSLTPRVQSRWQSATYLAFNNQPYQRQRDYSSTDATLTYRSESKRWTVEGYVRNIENETVIISAIAAELIGSYYYNLRDPRTYGARLVVQF